MDFKPGDLVKLKSGGPVMTVEAVGDHYGTPTVWCVWFEKVGPKQTKQTETFAPVVLEAATQGGFAVAQVRRG
jgi:uncharacterized protein YodC (DUF2158 family)